MWPFFLLMLSVRRWTKGSRLLKVQSYIECLGDKAAEHFDIFTSNEMRIGSAFDGSVKTEQGSFSSLAPFSALFQGIS